VDATAAEEQQVTGDQHERFRAGVAAHLAGLLSPEESAWMDAHDKECAECGELMSRAQARMGELRSGEAHIPVAMLSTFLRVPNDLTPLERELVGRHLKSCEACRKDMEEMARFAGIPPRMKAPGASGGGWGGMGTASVLAAAAVVAVIGLWLQARHPPPTPSAPPVAAIPSPTPEVARGGEPLLVFHEQTRAATTSAPASDTLRLETRRVRVQLPVLFLQRDSEVLVTVSTAAGSEVARDTLSTEPLARPFELAATIGPWNAGDYVLRVIPAAGRDTTATRVFEFRLLHSP